MASVKVAVRVRPINEREISLGSTCIISTEGRKTSITNLKIPAQHRGGEAGLGRERVKTFTYDYSYWSVNPSEPQFASQEKVFNDLGEDVLKSATEGYNACIFAYGQTGSGKSYTMMGHPGCPGLIPRICEGLFSRIKKEDDYGISFRAEVSYLEIYCERVRDLLRPSTQYTLRVREHPRDGPYVQDLSKHLVSNYEDVQALMDKGNQQRTTASTMMNDTSSRSHAIFTITFTQAKFHDDIPCETNSKINLVDLAGSERADATGATGDRLKEGANINKSLVTLGNVISALADMSSMASSPGNANNKRRSMVFIPYRDSVLTWLLKDSLGGNSKTIMVATISPADVNYGETLSTLRYANRAKNIINKPTINEDPNVRLIRQLRAEIARLKACMTGLDFTDIPTVDKLHESEAMMRKLTEEWATKWNETQKLMKDRTLALRSEGTGVVLDSELPHLIGIDDNLLSTGLKLYHIKEGKTTIGNQDAKKPCDICISGADVYDEHCWLTNNGRVVTLYPADEAVCSVNGNRVRESIHLTQGCIVAMGESSLLRFNHPEEAKRLRNQLKSKSLNDLTKFRSTENLLAATLRNSSGIGSERTHKEEWDRLEQKRIEIKELEEKFEKAERQRQEDQKKEEQDLLARQQQIEAMRQQREQAQHQAEEAQHKLEEERKRRQSRDVVKQLEEYNREKERQCTDFHSRIEELEAKRQESTARCEEMAAALEAEREKTTRGIQEERQSLDEMKQKMERESSERQEKLIEEKKRLEDVLRREREEFRTDVTRLEEKRSEMKDALDKAKEDLQKKHEQVQQERDEEHHFLEIEREKLEALKTKHEVTRRLAKTMDKSVKKQLAMENKQVATAWEDFDKLKQRQLDAIEIAEKKIQAKAENLVSQIWQSRTNLKEKKVELERRKRETHLAIEKTDDGETRERLRSLVGMMEEEERGVLDEVSLLDAREADMEKDIEEEFVALEKKKRNDEDILEAEWSKLLKIEAANLHYVEQELSDRNAVIERQKAKLAITDRTLERFNVKRSRTLDLLQVELDTTEDEKTAMEKNFNDKQRIINDNLRSVDGKLLELVTWSSRETEDMVEQKTRLEGAVASQNTLEQMAEPLRQETERLQHLVEEIASEKHCMEELLQTKSFSESRFKEEQRKLNEKMESLKLLEEQTKEKEMDLIRQQEEFERERQAERDKISCERLKLKELENQERISKLVEEAVMKRLQEERIERAKTIHEEKETERIERDKLLEQMTLAHRESMEKLRKQMTRRLSSDTMSISENSDTTPSRHNDTVNKISQLTPHTEMLKNPILINIPHYLQRGHGWDSYYVFEVQIQVLDEKWQIYRRYSKFRELHDYMRNKVPGVAKLNFPPKNFFSNWSDKTITRRKIDLEFYLRDFIGLCLKFPGCPLAPGPGRVISKQVLCEFATFFRKGTFETTKYGTG